MNDTSHALVPFGDLEKMAGSVAASKLFGCKTKDEALALMLVAQSEGMHPMTAVQEFHIIQGRPARKAESILARFQRAGGKVVWHKYSDTEVSGTFSHPQGGEVTVTWNMARAKVAGFADKDNYKKFPAPMFRSRCISEGVRTVFPGATGGMYTPEELEDMPAREAGHPEPVVMPQARSEQPPAKPVAEDAEIVMPPAHETEPAPQTSAADDAPQATPISEGAVRLLLAKLAAASLTDAELCKRFGIAKLTLLKAGQMNDALAWIKNPNGGAS